jgi:hypothetical protein
MIFSPATINKDLFQEDDPATEATRFRNATITVPQAQTPHPAKSQRPVS